MVTQAADLSLGSLAKMVEGNAIDVSPNYQRRARWDVERQSALIESFLLNIPVPPVYLAEDEFGKYSVVDGKQRLTAITDFITDKFRLTKLETFKEIEGLKFTQLPRDLQNSLDVRPYLRVITLLKQSDPLLKYEVFVRLNRGGESMEAQEIRNVAFIGPLNTLIYKLSKNEFLRQQLKIKGTGSGAYRLMADAELVLRFVTLRNNWNTYAGDLRRTMDKFMSDHRFAKPTALKLLRSKYERAIKGCEAIWGNAAFKRPAGGGWRDQFLNGMYDAQMLAIDELSDRNVEKAISRRSGVITSTRNLFREAKFDRAVREATNTPSRLVYRVEKLVEVVGEAG